MSGQVAVMAINERLLQAIMDKNPDLAFALEESFPLKSTYAGASLLGPLMELRASDPQDALTAQTAAQAVDYWRNVAQDLSSDAEAAPDSPARRTYSKMAVAQANLLADHQYGAQAEQAYRIALEICPYNPEAVFNYIGLLAGQQRWQDALPVAQAAAQADPGSQQLQALLSQVRQKLPGR